MSTNQNNEAAPTDRHATWLLQHLLPILLQRESGSIVMVSGTFGTKDMIDISSSPSRSTCRKYKIVVTWTDTTAMWMQPPAWSSCQVCKTSTSGTDHNVYQLRTHASCYGDERNRLLYFSFL
ncbi:hypothetical protein OPV22_026849 [Ensete ventricosum]|uniref:Uncharacterized protein n=1 Tax=Ensete ventricosum TaxID=4639 RepID=A0AAV8P2E5_ENSVE|nr:hypothetical protein OPV22_026849 [Ensete ventricosum]